MVSPKKEKTNNKQTTKTVYRDCQYLKYFFIFYFTKIPNLTKTEIY